MNASYCATRLNAATASAKRCAADAGAVVLFQIVDESGVLRRIGQYRDARVILCRRAQHRRAADIDVLDRLVERMSRVGGHLFERIQIDHQQIDRRDFMLLHHGGVDIRAAEQAAVDFRMQGLDPAVHDFRKAGDPADLGHVEAGIAQRPRGAAGGNQLGPARAQRPRQIDQPGFVGDAEQRAPDRYEGGGGHGCSAGRDGNYIGLASRRGVVAEN